VVVVYIEDGAADTEVAPIVVSIVGYFHSVFVCTFLGSEIDSVSAMLTHTNAGHSTNTVRASPSPGGRRARRRH
jgi:hypothetical protein